MFEFLLKFHWIMFLAVQSIVSQYWSTVRHLLGSKPLPEPMMAQFLHIYASASLNEFK